ncbi:MAG: Phosphopantetheine attachment site [Pseudomonadota bacterium]
MERDRAFELVRTTIATEFRVEESLVTAETVASDVAGWDSFSHCNLIMAIESRLGCSLPFDELLEAGNVGDLCDIVEKAAP